MISLSKHAFRIFFFCIMGLVLVACGGSSTVGNGQNLANLSGKAGSVKTFNIKLPFNATGLMIQAAGSADIRLDLQDSAGNSLGICTQPLFCVWQTPVEGTYKLQLQATADYSGVNLSASWGGPDVGVLKNDIALTGLKGDASTVLLKSLFLPENVPLLKVAASGSTDVQLELLDSLGNPVWYCGSHSCLFPALQANLYYVRATATAAYSGVSLKANWGASFGATMENGDTVRYSNVQAYSQINEAFYWPEGVEAVALATSASGAGIMLVGSNGEYAPMQCVQNGGSVCVASALAPGLYHVSVMMGMESVDLSLTLRFGGRNHSTVSNGQSTAAGEYRSGDQVLESFYIEPGTTAAAVGVSIFTPVRVYDVNGNRMLCEYQPCYLNDPQPGTYFAFALIEDATAGPYASVSLATGSPDATTLVSGQTKRGSFEYEFQEKVESFYVGPNVDAFAIFLSDEYTYAYITDAAGTFIAACSITRACIAEVSTPGVYFAYVSYHNVEGSAGRYQISLALGGQDASTLGSGQTTVFQSVQTNDLFAESFYVSLGMSSAAFVSSMNTQARIYSTTGASVACTYQPCFMNNLQPGVYFVEARVIETEYSSSSSLSLALGGEEGATITNAQTKRDSFDFSYQEKVDSFHIKSGVDAVAIAVAGDNVSASIVDTQGNFVTYCNSVIPCIFKPTSDSTYYIFQHFNGSGESDGHYSISLTLGGEDVATLESGQPSAPRPVVAGETFVESFQITEGMTSFSFTAGMDSYGAIYNADGQTVCTSLPCILNSLTPGTYFASITPFDGGLATHISASFAAGGPNHGTLTNGQTKKSVINHTYEDRVESFYAGTGVDSFILASSNQNIGFYIVDENFEPVADCWVNAPCIGQIATPGVYFVHLSFHTALVGQEYSISLALGGEQAATLKWDEVAPVHEVNNGDILVHSVYRHSASDVTAISSSDYTTMRVFDAYGNVQCEGSFCTLKNMPAGSYFLVSEVFNPFSSQFEAGFAVAETGPEKSDMKNGEVLFVEGVQHQRVLKSLKLEEVESMFPTIDSLVVRNSDTYVELTLFDDQGQRIDSCYHLAPCVVRWPGREHLFVLVEIFYIPEDSPASISAAWTGPGVASMEKEVNYSLSTPTPVFQSVQSFSLDAESNVQLFMNSAAIEAAITNINGQPLLSCLGEPCPSLDLPAGHYFLMMTTTPAIEYTGDTFQYSLTW